MRESRLCVDDKLLQLFRLLSADDLLLLETRYLLLLAPARPWRAELRDGVRDDAVADLRLRGGRGGGGGHGGSGGRVVIVLLLEVVLVLLDVDVDEVVEVVRDPLVEVVSAAAAADRGTVLVPPGRFITGAFNLTSGVTLDVQAGAVVIGSTDRHEHPLVPSLPSYVSDRSKLRPQSLVMIVAGVDGAPCENVRVVGGGVIDGNGSAFWYKKGPDSSGDWTNMEIHNCTNVEITGITLRNPANWNLHPWFSRDVWIHDMTLEAPCRSPSTDGIDPDSCDGMLIERVNITSGDDHIAIKSGRDVAGRAFASPSRNITVRGNWHGCGGGISIGSECSGGVEDILIQDIVHEGPSSFHGVGIKTAPARGGYVRCVHRRPNMSSM